MLILLALTRRLVATLSLLILLIVCASAQTTTTSTTDRMTPSGMATGAPAGSYALSGFDHVNLFNGNLDFRLPLLGIGGRGGAAYQMTLALNLKSWRVKHVHKVLPDGNEVDTDTPTKNGGISSGYGMGSLSAKQIGLMTSSNLTCKWYSKTLTRLNFSTSDGTEFELRDQLTGGQPMNSTCTQGAARGTVFSTADGSAATFISDAPVYDKPSISGAGMTVAGYLMLRDGTRFRIDSGSITWMRDPNGNRLSFTYDTSGMTVTDSLNRRVTVEYNVSDVAPYGVCDRVTFNGFGGAQRIIRVSSTTLSNALRPGSGYFIQTLQQLFPELNGASSTTTHNPTVVSAVWLPDGRRYQLFYNSYSELAKVILPTGGAIEYDMTPGSGVVCAYTACSQPADGGEIYRRVVERRVYPDGSTLEGKSVFAVSPSGYPPAKPWTSIVTVDQLTPAGALLARDKHYYQGNAVGSLFQSFSFDVYSKWDEGFEYRTEALDANGTTVLRRVDKELRQRAPVSWWSAYASQNGLDPSEEPPNDPRLVETIMTLVDTNQVSKQSAINPQTGAVGFDQYNNQTDVYEYGYGAGAAGALVRRTHTDYVTTNVVNGITYNYDTDTSIHMRGLIRQTSVYDATGIEQARSAFEYDNYTATANHAALVARPLISGLDAAYTTTYQNRGNVTAITRSLLTNGAVTGSISTYQQYDVAGNVVNSIDGRGYQTALTFSDRFGSPDAEARLNSGATELGTQASYAFPTLVTNALGQTTYLQRDYYTGQIVDAEDLNGVTSSVYRNDILERPTQVIRAANDAALRSQTTYIYDDINRIATTTSDLSVFGDNALKSQSLYDGLGRATETRNYESPTAYATIKQTYDALGRPSQTSNPYRTGQTIAWTTITYDALGRSSSVRTPDNAITTTVYSGNTRTVTDQAGKDRQSATDALGRLTQVVEDPGTGGLGYSTTYAYDALSNLKTVTQGAQTRTFTYDSLTRLKTAASPESGTTSYVYDNNGNLTQKTDARSISTALTYDALNRPTLKTYSDTTPAVAYFYDAQALPAGAPSFVRGASIGRLVAVTTGATSAGNYYGYDALGQTLRRIQQTDSVNYLVDATYNRAGAMSSETYPQVPGYTGRRTVSYSFDTAGRLSSLTTAATTYATAASVSGISYAAHGGLESETLGNNLVHALSYNNRIQPTQIKLGTAAAPTSVLNLSYNYGTTNNNGNVLDVTNTVGAWTTKQIHTYDPLNRLDATQETNGSTTTYWTEDDAYDRYGNRWEINAGVPSLAFNAANNRISTTGYMYDAAGNLTNDTVHTYGYDAESRIKSVDGVANSYQYDGEGKRVRKYFPLGEQIRFVYGIHGQLIAEFATTNGAVKKEYIYGSEGLLATIEPSIGTRYTTADNLGTPRVVTGSTGAVVSRHDYQPFGEELASGVGGRTTGQGYSQLDGVRLHFTGQERDDETGLDYYGARYYASPQGRFTVADSIIMAPERALDPQQINLYAYARNNPLRFTDPTGEIIVENVDAAYKERYEKWKKEYLSTEAGRKQWAQYADDPNFTLTIVVADRGSDKDNKGALTDGYEWNESGTLVAATITLGKNLESGYGDPSNYPVTSSLAQGDQRYNAAISGVVNAAAKFAHEFGHVNRTANVDAAQHQLQTQLVPQWNEIYFNSGPNDPRLAVIERQMGGTPVQLKQDREHWAEANAVRYLRDRFPGGKGESMPRRVRKAIESYQKTYPGR